MAAKLVRPVARLLGDLQILNVAANVDNEAECLSHEEREALAQRMERMAAELTCAALRMRRERPEPPTSDWVPPYLLRGGPSLKRRK